MTKLIETFNKVNFGTESAKAKVRVLNHIMIVAILMGFFVVGQFTRNPDKNAYASIMQIMKLPIFITAGDNNNNNCTCTTPTPCPPEAYPTPCPGPTPTYSPEDCDDLKDDIVNLATQLKVKAQTFDSVVDELLDTCGDPDDMCQDELQDAMDALQDVKTAIAAIVAAIAIPPGSTGELFAIAFASDSVVNAVQASQSANQAYQDCMAECQILTTQVNMLYDDMVDINDDLQDTKSEYAANCD